MGFCKWGVVFDVWVVDFDLIVVLVVLVLLCVVKGCVFCNDVEGSEFF